MKYLPFLVFALWMLAGCATRGALADQRRETNALAREVSEKYVKLLDHNGDILGQLNSIDRRLQALESRLNGPWDREECENYTPAAQKMFCHRKPMAADASFEELAEKTARELNAHFCKKATEAWQVQAFCHGAKK